MTVRCGHTKSNSTGGRMTMASATLLVASLLLALLNNAAAAGSPQGLAAAADADARAAAANKQAADGQPQQHTPGSVLVHDTRATAATGGVKGSLAVATTPEPIARPPTSLRKEWHADLLPGPDFLCSPGSDNCATDPNVCCPVGSTACCSKEFPNSNDDDTFNCWSYACGDTCQDSPCNDDPTNDDPTNDDPTNDDPIPTPPHSGGTGGGFCIGGGNCDCVGFEVLDMCMLTLFVVLIVLGLITCALCCCCCNKKGDTTTVVSMPPRAAPYVAPPYAAPVVQPGIQVGAGAGGYVKMSGQ